MNPYILLLLAIVTEITATSALKVSYGLSKLYPSMIVLIGYTLSFFCMSLTLKVLPVNIVYAIWSGLGILGIALIGVFYFREEFGIWHLVGTSLILAGVVLLALMTKIH